MAARKPDGIKWLGLFQALSGLPQGVHPQNALGALNELLGPVPPGALQPRNGAAAMAFYDAMLAAVNRHGFSFIKMDFEANNFGVAMGTPNPVEAAVNNQRAYQAAVEKHLDGTINCMAHYAPGIFNTGNSGMTRVAQDYKKENATNARSAALQLLWQRAMGRPDRLGRSRHVPFERQSLEPDDGGGPGHVGRHGLPFRPRGHVPAGPDPAAVL